MSLGTDLRGAFEQINVQHKLTIYDPSYATIKSEHTFVLRALRQSRFFERAYSWTGRGIEKDPVIVSGTDEIGHQHHRLHGPVIESGIDRLFLIDLGRTIQPGQEELVSVEQTFIDVEGSFRPFLGHTAQVGCLEIELCVRLPSGSCASAYFMKSYAQSGRHLERQNLVTESGLDEADVLRRVVRTPQEGMNYKISWTRN